MNTIVFLLWTQVWQIALLFVVVWLVTWRIREHRPHLALVLWCVFFVKCMTPPIILAPVGMFAWQTPVVTPSNGQRSSPLENAIGVGESVDSQLTVAGVVKPSLTRDDFGEKPDYVTEAILGLWLGGSLCFLVLTYLYVRRIRARIVGSQIPTPVWVSECTRRVHEITGFELGENQLVFTSSRMGPLVLGFYRPTIVIPDSLIGSKGLAERVLAHEVCHVWRRDHWLSGLQFVAQCLFWFHPLIWIASRETNRLCEICCDDDTLRLFDLPARGYAECLVDILEQQRDLRTVQLMPGIRPVDITKDRIRRLLSGNRRVRFRGRYFAWAFALLLIVVPAGWTQNWAIEFQTAPATGPSMTELDEWIGENEATGFVSDEAGRHQMDFLIGSWDVHGPAGKVLGRSTFSFEPSGNMIREDWVSSEGETAEGITYYDPNLKCWVITWVDSRGTIMDSKGRWSGNQLRHAGLATRKSGETTRTRSLMTRISSTEIRLELQARTDGEYRLISVMHYRR